MIFQKMTGTSFSDFMNICGRTRIVQRLFVERGLRNRAALRSVRWVFPTVRDRVVQTALVHVIEPIFDNTFHERSFGFRHGRGCHHALECVEQLLNDGYVFVVDADLKSYFDMIPKDRLMQFVQQSISDRRVLGLIQKYLDQNIMDGLSEWTPDAGVPQGAVLSQRSTVIFACVCVVFF